MCPQPVGGKDGKNAFFSLVLAPLSSSDHTPKQVPSKIAFSLSPSRQTLVDFLQQLLWAKQKVKYLWKGCTGPLSRADESTASPACFHGQAAWLCLLAFSEYFTLRWNIHELLPRPFFNKKDKKTKWKMKKRAVKGLLGTCWMLFRCFYLSPGCVSLTMREGEKKSQHESYLSLVNLALQPQKHWSRLHISQLGKFAAEYFWKLLYVDTHSLLCVCVHICAYVSTAKPQWLAFNKGTLWIRRLW